ncbi:MAG TPA: hydantoinase/oxoprolinase family protein [Solirubrobacteraceae bacterium]|nr:hydantoinase/oxoprolinase family protein [Solirubrobacteraceae bacterium]
MTSGGRARVGVDVGGTFTKAVACDLETGAVVARAVLPTTHDDPQGVAAGVVRCVAQVAAQIGGANIELVTHSTTQAVNALLEGDVGRVGVLGLGRKPDLRKARKRTCLDRVDLSPGRRLQTSCEFLDVSDGLAPDALEAAIARMLAAGVTSACVAEAFATEDDSHEATAVAALRAAGLPACASCEMSGLYGLELRTVTAAINSSVLPIAVQTAGYVEAGVAAAGIDSPVMVMRGDGGATDLGGFRREPARTLYSGPAASVAGVLRFTRIEDGIVVEIGGTSTNVAAIKAGQPRLSYVQVASHATALRALDVRVVGVAGGSMLRARKRTVYGVGPRSAHISGLSYACFATPEQLAGATAELAAPRLGDTGDHVVITCTDGTRLALTNTCAANLLRIPQPADYAFGSHAAAAAAFEIAGPLLRLPAEEIARRMLVASGTAIAELVAAVMSEHELKNPTLVAVGGGAGGLGRYVAEMMGLECFVPEGAEVISSIGDALSLVRAERELAARAPTPEAVATLTAQAREAAIAAGAAPGSIDVRIEHSPERAALRAIATGAVGLHAGAMPGRRPIDAAEAGAILARAHCHGDPQAVGSFWVGHVNSGSDRIIVLDRFGDAVVDTAGDLVDIDGGAASGVADMRSAVLRNTKRLGPVMLPPTIWVIHSDSLVEIASGDVGGTAETLASGADGPCMVLVSRR